MLIPLHYMRGNFALGEFANGLAELLLLTRQGEFHETSQEKNMESSTSFIPQWPTEAAEARPEVRSSPIRTKAQMQNRDRTSAVAPRNVRKPLKRRPPAYPQNGARGRPWPGSAAVNRSVPASCESRK